MIKRINSILFFKIVFVLSLCVLLFVSTISFKHSLNLSRSTEALIKSYKVRLELEHIISYIKDSETGIRGYIITKDSSFLSPYWGSRERVNTSFIILKKLSKDNKVQYENLNMLYELIKKRYKYFNNTLNGDLSYEYSKNKTFNKNFILGKVSMDLIRNQIQLMQENEVEVLKQRNKEYQYQNFLTPIFTIFVILVSLILIVLSYFKINRSIIKLRETNNRLSFLQEASNQAEIIGGISSWSWDLELDTLIFSENHYRLLGAVPYSFEPTNENILKIVHSDDISMIEAVIANIQNVGDIASTEFRIIRIDTGEIRFLKSAWKMTRNNQGNHVIIGNNTDITEQRIANIKIEERNKELERSNMELASFNHVASHDLQEPLRKIQTFISRFSEEDRNLLSEKSISYLSKIEDAASRMRLLIDDLLLFSRTNKIEKNYNLIPLNDILENSKQEFIQAILDQNITIAADNLPTIKAIPFQMQQLFNNLIGNSIKYSREMIPLKINITTETIKANQLPDFMESVAENYFKLEFKDNGMGFNPEYSEKIFVLFNRLHKANEYPGTGIGLTICKKIVDNHKGFIEATGAVNQGATFTVYLPCNL
jgi:signal transduction histidine kinase